MESIHIENLSNNEDIYHPIVLIKGSIEKLSRNDPNISIFHFETSTKFDFLLDARGSFKATLELLQGKNKIILTCNGQSLELILNYVSLLDDCKRANLKYIQPIYLVPADNIIPEDLVNKNCEKLLLGCKLAQCLYSEKLLESTGIRKTFQLKSDCKIFALPIRTEEAQKLSDLALWEYTARQLVKSSIWNPNVKYVAFVSFTKYLGLNQNEKYTYENIKSRTLSNPALSTGGLALLGTGCLYTWPLKITDVINCFFDSTKIDIKTQLDDSNYRCTYGGCYSTTLGSLCHELGHIFDLGHTPNGIMGKDVDYTSRVFTTKLRTENLPERMVGTKSLNKPAAIDNVKRFTKIKQPGQYLIKYHEQKDDDLTYFAQNNAVTLFYHKWFNQFKNQGVLNEAQIKNKMHFNGDSCTVQSDRPLVFVEIRDNESEMTVKYWVFLEKDIFEFQMPSSTDGFKGKILFAMDKDGFTLKENIGAN